MHILDHAGLAKATRPSPSLDGEWEGKVVTRSLDLAQGVTIDSASDDVNLWQSQKRRCDQGFNYDQRQTYVSDSAVLQAGPFISARHKSRTYC